MTKKKQPLERFRSRLGPIDPDLWENDNLRLPLERGCWSDDFNQWCERLVAEANFKRAEAPPKIIH
jgi:hypothetical protein